MLYFSIVTASHAQSSFSHSFGSSNYLGNHIGAWGLNYSPRINFMEINDETTLSVGSHLGVGLGSSYAFIDLPLAFELNWGHASSPLSDANFGAFIGGGYNYLHLTHIRYNPEMTPPSPHGPMVNGGLRAHIFDMSLTLRAAYTLNVVKQTDREETSNIIIVGLFLNLN